MTNLPSVTQVLSIYQTFSGVRGDVLARAAERGQRVHQICAALLQNLWIPEIPEECAGYVESFKLWAPYIEETVLVEAELVDKNLGFRGRLDWAGRIRGDDHLSVLDWKTPLAKGKLWRAQVAAYGWLAIKNNLAVTRIASLRLRANGKAPVMDEYDQDPHDMAAFVAALQAYKYFKEG